MMIEPEENPGLERTRYELRADGVPRDAANPLRSGIHTRGFLPHVKREGARYFVTFRLADSLPKDVLLKYQAERAERLHRLNILAKTKIKPGSAEDSIEKIERDYFRKLEHFLDTGQGE